MTAKDYLGQIKKLDICIRQKENELRDLKSIIYSVPASNFGDERVRRSLKNTTYSKVDDSIELEQIIAKQKNDYIKTKHRIIDEIQKLNRSDYITLLTARYIEFKTFEQIADEMGYSYRHITRLHKDALIDFANTILCP